MKIKNTRCEKALICFALCLLFLCGVQKAWAVEFTADISEEIMNSKAVGTIMVHPKGYRMDLSVTHKKGKSESAIIIVDKINGKTRLFNPQTKTYKEVKSFSFLAFMLDPFQGIEQLKKVATSQKVGSVKVSGFLCDHYAYYDKDFKLADVWYALELDSFPIKAHMVSGRNDRQLKIKINTGDTRFLMSNIKPGPVDTASLNIPAGFSKAPDPREARKKALAALPAVKQTVQGKAPWGRRIGEGGEIRIKLDPMRPVAIELRNFYASSTGSYKVIPQKAGQAEIKPQTFDFTKNWQRKKVEISKKKKTEWVYIRVEKGLIYATVVNAKDPFKFSRDSKLEEGYLHSAGGRGAFVDPSRKLTVSVTGDSQDAKDSEFVFSGCKGSCKDKLFEKRITIANGQTKTWEFPAGHKITICDFRINKTGAVKFRIEQPAKESAKKSISKAKAGSTASGPKVVRTTPIKSYGKSTKKSPGKSGNRLNKVDSRVIIKALNHGDVKTVKAYLDKGMDANIYVYGAPLLQKAANLSTAEMVKLIIERGGDLFYQNRSGDNALAQAQSNFKHWREVIPVLVKAGVPVDKQTAIWKIAFKTKGGKFKPGAKEMLEYLLDKGADINAPISNAGTTLLMNAAKMAWLEPVEFYLAHGADAKLRDKNNKTALDWAKTPRSREKLYQKQQRQKVIELLESK